MKKTYKPITPSEAEGQKTKQIPEFVFDCFNKAIIENLKGDTAIIGQSRVCAHIRAHEQNTNDEFQTNWLNVESIYESAGWLVTYDKPGYNEAYEPKFTFKAQ